MIKKLYNLTESLVKTIQEVSELTETNQSEVVRQALKIGLKEMKKIYKED